MTRLRRAARLIPVMLMCLAACAPRPLTVRGAWSRPCGAGAVCVVYVTMDNSGGPADALVGAATEAAAAAELHQTIVQSNGAVTMKQHEQAALPAGRVTEFKPGGWHVMLVEARRDLRAGDVFSLTLRFQQAGEVNVPVSVRDE